MVIIQNQYSEYIQYKIHFYYIEIHLMNQY